MEDYVAKSPSNWKRWGENDEIGALNFLTQAEVVRGVGSVKSGKVFTMGIKIGDPNGDPVSKNRIPRVPIRLNVRDRGSYIGRKTKAKVPYESADDIVLMAPHATTHFDSLGHVWMDGELWNGYDANTTIDSLDKCSIVPIAEHGIIGRGVLLDIARFKGVKSLRQDTEVTLEDLLACASHQDVKIEKHDILMIRTGWLRVFYEDGPNEFYHDPYEEPGLTYREDLVRWFHEMEIPVLGTDTFGNEMVYHPETRASRPLHLTLLYRMGVLFNELVWLDKLSQDCATDGQWDFLYVASPLKLVGSPGAPANPVAIK